ncbi:uncharacterized protein LOC119674006 [Teleopsis dalmanni]|uniref:uncharacterized protein LOC119674006 n=1 Tax=Teleopsis dalmanni TaxID=139649 RepID=UPI0018CD76F6|nr:uncharacterized protein LOC119674006 [Teleopsis dalmanni]
MISSLVQNQYAMVRIIVFLLWSLLLCETSFGKINHTFEPIDASFYTSNPNVIDSKLSVYRISRGKYGLNGFIDIKQDLSNDYMLELYVLRSVSGNDRYIPTAIRMPPKNLEYYMNKVYKRIIMTTFSKCAPNSPQFQTEFKAPLTKRRFDLNKCLTDTTNFPYVRSGFYKVGMRFIKPYNITWEITAKTVTTDHF